MKLKKEKARDGSFSLWLFNYSSQIDTPLKSHRNPKRFRAFEKMSGMQKLISLQPRSELIRGVGVGIYITAVARNETRVHTPTWSKGLGECACVDDCLTPDALLFRVPKKHTPPRRTSLTQFSLFFFFFFFFFFVLDGVRKNPRTQTDLPYISNNCPHVRF